MTFGADLVILVGAPRGFFNTKNMSFIDYLKSTKAELRHVNWPTRREAVVFTLIVIVISIVVGAYLGVLDFVFTSIIKTFII